MTFTSDASVFDEASIPCFAEGTLIQTVRGAVAVEALVEGDEVVTASGLTRPVIWIGSRRIKVAAHPTPAEVNPIRIRAHTFAPGVPSRDLRLSPGHAVYVDGALVPAGHLVNGATVVQEEVETIRYFHIELDAHDVLLAQGLSCESYLDDGNRDVFANSPDHVALYGRLDPVDWDGACAPVLRDWASDHAALLAIKARLHARAEALGWVAAKATPSALTLRLADGTTLSPVHDAADRVWFLVPAAGPATLISSAARPFDTEPGQLDTRRLGVAVSATRLNGLPMELESEAFGAGFHDLERHDHMAWRWTDGAGVLTIPAAGMLELVLPMTASAWTRPAAKTLHLVRVN